MRKRHCGFTRDDPAVRVDKLMGKARIAPRALAKQLVDVKLAGADAG